MLATSQDSARYTLSDVLRSDLSVTMPDPNPQGQAYGKPSGTARQRKTPAVECRGSLG